MAAMGRFLNQVTAFRSRWSRSPTGPSLAILAGPDTAIVPPDVPIVGGRYYVVVGGQVEGTDETLPVARPGMVSTRCGPTRVESRPVRCSVVAPGIRAGEPACAPE